MTENTIYVHLFDLGRDFSADFVHAARTGKAVSLYFPRELPLTSRSTSDKIDIGGGGIFFNIEYIGRQGAYLEKEVLAFDPKYFVEPRLIDSLVKRIGHLDSRIGNHNPPFARELNLIADPTLDYSRKAMIPIVQAQERQIEDAKRMEREERQGERNYWARQEFTSSLPSASRERERREVKNLMCHGYSERKGGFLRRY